MVVEDSHPPRSLAGRTVEIVEQDGVGGLVNALGRKARARGRKTHTRATLETQFGDLWHHLDRDIASICVKSVNDDVVVRRLRELGDPAVLDQATSIVREAVINQAGMTLNVHCGLSPYYRGSFCTEWALIMWDPANIGVTVHELTRDIDGGAIAGQKRAIVTPGDTVHSLNMQLARLGTEIVVDALSRVAAGEKLLLVEQDLSKGVVTYVRQWSPRLSSHVARIERNETLARMIESPSRGPQPIVSLSSSPRRDEPERS